MGSGQSLGAARASELTGETPLTISWDAFYPPAMSNVSQAMSDSHHSPKSQEHPERKVNGVTHVQPLSLLSGKAPQAKSSFLAEDFVLAKTAFPWLIRDKVLDSLNEIVISRQSISTTGTMLNTGDTKVMMFSQ